MELDGESVVVGVPSEWESDDEREREGAVSDTSCDKLSEAETVGDTEAERDVDRVIELLGVVVLDKREAVAELEIVGESEVDDERLKLWVPEGEKDSLELDEVDKDGEIDRLTSLVREAVAVHDGLDDELCESEAVCEAELELERDCE